MIVPRRGFHLALALCLAFRAFAAEGPGALAEGERLFRENKPAEALPWLEKAVKESPTEERAWLYQGVVLQMLGRYDEAVKLLQRGLPQAGGMRHLFHYNMGNAYALLGRASFAEEMYNLAMGEDPSFAPVFLNRANARTKLGNLRGAVADYRRYLELEPGSAQRTAIEDMIRLMGEAMATEDRKAAEAEAWRIAEAAARQAMLDEVTASLKAAAEETTSFSAGSGSIQGYGDDITLDE